MYSIIKTVKDFQECLKHVEENEYISYDTESTGLNVRSCEVIGLSVAGKPGYGFYLPIKLWNGELLVYHNLGNFNHITSYVHQLLLLLTTKKLLMHNGSFDIRITKNNLKVDLIDALYCDTILLKHTCNEEPPFGMEELVKRNEQLLLLPGESSLCKDTNVLKDNIKKNGGSTTKVQYEIWRADLEVLGRYGAIDADLTLRLFNLYSRSLKEQGLEKFFYELEVMPLYKEVTIPMEENGILLNMDLLRQMDGEISTDIDILEDQIQDKLKIYSTVIEKDILDKNVKISSKGGFAQELLERYEFTNLKRTPAGKFSLTEKNLVDANYSSNEKQKTILNFLLTGEADFSMLAEFDRIQRELYLKSTGDRYVLNLNSKDQLSKVFFDEMGESCLKETPGGKPQLNDDFLESIAHSSAAAKLLLDYNKLVKIKSSYIDRFLREQENEMFYPRFKQHGTISGRYGSDLQQLSRPEDEKDTKLSPIVLKYNNVVREFFISKKDCVFLDTDYASLEPRTFAADAQDKSLLDIFEKDYDMYSTIALEVFGLKDQFSADSKDPMFLKKHKPELRQQAKAFALGIRYGMKAWKLSKSLNIEEDAAQKIIDMYFSAFPNLKRAMDKYLNSAKKFGFVKSPYGRIRHLEKANEYWAEYSDDIFEFKNYKKMDSIMRRTGASKEKIKEIRAKYGNLLNNALNFPIQSAASSIVNRASIAIARAFKEQGIKGKIIAQIHDQIIVECEDTDKDKAAIIIQEKMETTTELKGVKLIAEPSFCKNFKEGH